MSNKTLSERIEQGLDIQNDLVGYESHANAEGIINALNNELNTKMMTGEELTEDDLKSIDMVSKAFDIDPEQFTRDYLEGMEAQGFDISSLQEKINSSTGSNNNVGASSGGIVIDTGFEEQRGKSITKAIGIINNSTNDPLLRLKHLAEYTLNNSGIFQNDKKSLRAINKEAKAIKKELRKRKQPIPEAYNEFFYFLKHGRFPKNSGYTPPAPRQPQPQAQTQQVPQPQLQAQPQPKRATAPQNVGQITTKLKKALSLAKKTKTAEELNSLGEQLMALLNNIDYTKLDPNELARIMDFEKPIYDTFGISITEIKKLNHANTPTRYQQRQNQLDNIIGDMRPNDIIAQISGDSVGGEEYTQAEKNISELKKKHSQKEINKHLKTLKYIGYIGIAVSFFVGIIGTHFDIVYHLPKMEDTIGMPSVWILASFLALLITTGIHIPLEGLVNKKYLDRTREILIVMLIIAVPLKIYIDYKAIKNYTKTVAEENRVKELKNVTNSRGASINSVKMVRANEEKNLDRINAQLDEYTKQLSGLQAKRKPYEDFITKFSSKPKTKWRTTHIKEAKGELEELDSREASIQNHIDILQKQQAEYMGAITKNANAVVGILKQSEIEAKDEADSRFYMLVALMAMIELASLLHVLSDFLRTRNTPITLRELMEIQGAYDANKAVELMANRTKALINKGTIVSGEQALKGVEYQIWNGIRLQDSMLNSAHKMAEMSNQNTEKTVELIAETVVSRNNNISSEKLGRLVNRLIEHKGGNNE